MRMLFYKLTIKLVKNMISKALNVFLPNNQQRYRRLSPLSPQMQLGDEWFSGAMTGWAQSRFISTQFSLCHLLLLKIFNKILHVVQL